MAVLAGVDAASAQDPAFGISGVVRTDVGGWDTATDVLIQSDGKLLVAGTVDWNGTRNPFLVRYLGDGTLDSAFASGGKMISSRYTQPAPRIALQSDGRILLATRSDTAPYGVLVLRFNQDGSPDLAFGTGGAALIPSVSVSSIAGTAVGADGKITVAVRLTLRNGEAVGIARFAADGSPDTSFGQSGLLTVQSSYSWIPLAFALDPDGRIVVAGFANTGRGYTDAFVARLTSEGGFDSSFATSGIALIQQPSNGTEIQALALQPDGQIVAGGRAWGPAYYQSRWLLARYSDAGVLDSGFGSAGIVEFDPSSGHDVILGIGISPLGIYVAGQTETLSVGLPVARFSSSGDLDPTFGVSGMAGVAGLGATGFNRLALQPDEKVVVAGSAVSFVPTFTVDVYVARYIGAPDTAPPTLTVPVAVVADATSPAGAVVSYEVSATDNVDPTPAVVCAPATGSVFPIGDTTVNCSATDNAGNRATAIFVVHVKGAAEQLADLANAVVDVGPGSSLVNKVRQAEAFLSNLDTASALGELRALIDEVRAQTGKSIPADIAATLTATATRIANVVAG